jgi:hypothetical protein
LIDPITLNQTVFNFNLCVSYIDTVLFSGLPGQAELFMAGPTIAPFIKVISLFVTGLAAVDANSLVAQDSVSNIVIARRTSFVPFLTGYGLEADVAYAVTASLTHTRASAWFTSDDDARGGVAFTLQNLNLMHRWYNLIPGTIALPVTSTSLTALHEFGHALSSYSNGMVLDLYVDSPHGLNNRRGRPIPPQFDIYNSVSIATDSVRDSLSYPPAWQSYHCALIATSNPAVMDDYWHASGGSLACQHDEITRQFLIDRLHAKISRP